MAISLTCAGKISPSVAAHISSLNCRAVANGNGAGFPSRRTLGVWAEVICAQRFGRLPSDRVLVVTMTSEFFGPFYL